MAELTVMLVIILGGVAVAVTVKPSDSSSASSPLCRDTSRCLLPPPVYLFCPFLPSPRLSLSRFPSPFSTTSSSLFFLPPFGSLFIGAGGAGSTLPRPIAAHAWGAHRLLCHGADSGGQWRRRLRGTAALASHHEMGGI